MDEIYVTYVDDEHVDDHDCDDRIVLMMIMIITMISMFPDRTWAGPGPDLGWTGPDQAGPSQTSPKYIIFSQNIESTIVYNPG